MTRQIPSDISRADWTSPSYTILPCIAPPRSPQGLCRLRLAAGEYEPMVNISDFWLLEKHFVPINATLVDVPQNITLSFGVGSVHAWLLQSQMTGVQQQQVQMGIQSAREGFMLKRILLETNPFMLAFSATHAFLFSDMQFWYKNESMEGLSAVSLIFGFVCEETSWLILFEVFIGIAISGWKLTKAVKLERRHDFPFVRFSFTRSYSDSQTKDYDRTAITYASIALAPCLVGYAVYALLNNKYKSWYSYIISVLAGSVYTFGEAVPL
ncbi:cleft lip and palate transmembrane protein 1 [Cyclospora cayetanensis]|uniref:Cleft lip and palate transmembrane protein 1 n=1 Tax=Cyclospora cayetanensis TaxID=88456 RepID=A0A6P6S320_9EIME|nr:cleft lip and palate transmembrane protein 1 [Cyclospora cayetanensis]